jgi:hypothetical protein
VGEDATPAWTTKEGHVRIFVTVDHCTAEGVGIHAAKVRNCFEPLEPIRQGVRERFCVYGTDAAHGLRLRHDHGSQHVSDAFQNESSPFWGSSPLRPSCGRRKETGAPSGSSLSRSNCPGSAPSKPSRTCASHSIYNERWLIERHGHRSRRRSESHLFHRTVRRFHRRFCALHARRRE